MNNEFKNGDEVEFDVHASDGKTLMSAKTKGVVVGTVEKKKGQYEVRRGEKVYVIAAKKLRPASSEPTAKGDA